MVTSPINHSHERNAPLKASVDVEAGEVTGEVVLAAEVGEAAPDPPEPTEPADVVAAGLVATEEVFT